MKPFADKLGVTPVMELDSDHQMKYDNLSKLSGMEFDKTYMQAMDDDHHKALTLFKAGRGFCDRSCDEEDRCEG